MILFLLCILALSAKCKSESCNIIINEVDVGLSGQHDNIFVELLQTCPTNTPDPDKIKPATGYTHIIVVCNVTSWEIFDAKTISTIQMKKLESTPHGTPESAAAITTIGSGVSLLKDDGFLPSFHQNPMEASPIFIAYLKATPSLIKSFSCLKNADNWKQKKIHDGKISIIFLHGYLN